MESPDRGYDDEIDLRELSGIVRRRWWIILTMMVLAAAGAWLWTGIRPATYTAEALVQKQGSRSPLDVLGATTGGSDEAISSQLELLRSSAVLGTAVDALGYRVDWPDHLVPRWTVFAQVRTDPDAWSGDYWIYSENGEIVLVAGPQGSLVGRARPGTELRGPGISMSVAAGSRVDDPVAFRVVERELAIRRLRRELAVSRASRTSLISIRHSSHDPARAAEVVNAVVDAFIEHAARSSREDARRRREFLGQQLEQIADSLAAAQEGQLDYQRQLGVVNPQVEGQALVLAGLDAEKEVRALRAQEALLSDLARAMVEPGQTDDALRRTVAAGRDLVPGSEAMFARLLDLQAQRSRLTASRFGFTDAGREVEVVDSLIAITRSEIQSMSVQSLEVLRTRLDAAERRLTELQAEARALPGRATGYHRLSQRSALIQSTYNLLAEKYYEAQLAEAVEAGDIAVVDYASVPTIPDPARRRMFLLLGLMLGGMIGTGGAFIVDGRDRTIRGRDMVEAAAGAEILAVVPRLPRPRDSREVVALGERSPGAEAFRTLRTMITFSRSDPARVIGVTSALPGEGKSMIAAGLAVAFAREGKKVILVDADLPRPSQHQLWQLPLRPGLSDLLVKAAEPRQVFRRNDTYGINILTAGTPGPASSELASSKGFKALLDQMRQKWEIVIVDTAPVLLISDAAVAATLVDGMLLVARDGVTDRFALADAANRIRKVGGALLGVVLNDVKPSGDYGYYGYAYGEYYQQGKGGPPSRPGSRRRVTKATSVK